MHKVRLIARLDVKDSSLVKGIQLEGVRKLGDPHDFAKKYYEEGIDEIIYIDAVASLYNRNNLSNIVAQTCSDVFIPVTVGGGLRSIEDVRHILEKGADKVAINTAAIKKPKLITEVSEAFGSQCMVLSVQAKRSDNEVDKWEAYYDNGRQRSGLDVFEWIEQAIDLGAGEILLTSVDCEGLRKGMDIDLIKRVCKQFDVPIICCGGVGSPQDVVDAAKIGASGVGIASILHYKKNTVREIKNALLNAGLGVRNDGYYY